MNEPEIRSDLRQRYTLLTREGKSLVMLRLKDEGVTLGDDAIAWTADGSERSRRFPEITAISLQEGHAGVHLCEIDFREGPALRVLSVDRSGLTDSERSLAYKAFVRDFHERLRGRNDLQINFTAGNPAGGQLWRNIAFGLGGLLFIGGPLTLFLAGEPGAWFYLLIGPVAFLPALRLLRKNRPRAYTPGEIPNDLLP